MGNQKHKSLSAIFYSVEDLFNIVRHAPTSTRLNQTLSNLILEHIELLASKIMHVWEDSSSKVCDDLYVLGENDGCI